MKRNSCLFGIGVASFALLIPVILRLVALADVETEYSTTARLVVRTLPEVTHGPPSTWGADLHTTSVEILRSAQVRDRTLERLAALPKVPVTLHFESAAEGSLIVIAAQGSDPSYIVEYLNTLIDEFFVFRSEMRTGGPGITIESIITELARLDELRKTTELELEAYRQQGSTSLIAAERDALRDSLRDLHGRILNSEEQGGPAEERTAWQELVRQREARMGQLNEGSAEESRMISEIERVRKRFSFTISLLKDIDTEIDHREKNFISILDPASTAHETRPSFFGGWHRSAEAAGASSQ